MFFIFFFFCFFFFRLKSSISIYRNSNKHENLYVYIFSSWRVHCLVIFLLTFLLLVLLIVISTNNALWWKPKLKQTWKFACIQILLVVCATCYYIFVNPFTSCVTDRYLPQQYITMQTIKVVGNPRGTITKFFKSWLAKYLIHGEFLYQVWALEDQ